MKLKNVGIHLWAVGLSTRTKLWITTRRHSPEEAARKAKAVAKAYWDSSQVCSIKHRGTIDA